LVSLSTFMGRESEPAPCALGAHVTAGGDASARLDSGTVEEAEALAEADKFGFQWWAVGKLGAPPIEEKKGRDRGVDGRIYFHDDAGPAKHIVISVKAGQVGPAAVRELRGVVERDKASMGILVTVRQRTQEMIREAAVAGMYKSINGAYPKLQIVTVEDMFADKTLSLPGKKINPYEPKRPTNVSRPAEQLRLLP
jgi:site-specific DNA-methyltransferase (adenine-specific)